MQCCLWCICIETDGSAVAASAVAMHSASGLPASLFLFTNLSLCETCHLHAKNTCFRTAGTTATTSSIQIKDQDMKNMLYLHQDNLGKQAPEK